MTYAFWVVLGILLAVLAARSQGDVTGIPRAQRSALALCAVGGAVLGAYGLQLPADLLGWNAPPPPGGAADPGLPLGGRTVLGGLIGGWLAVELGKRAGGIRAPSGDAFALPLALALGCGRIGCTFAGCCAGTPCSEAWWVLHDAAGVARVPVQLVEAAFHFAIASVLLGTRALRGRRLAAYLTGYAILRFLLERVRQNPVVALGLTWHQFLALGLLVLAGGTWLVRSVESRVPSP